MKSEKEIIDMNKKTNEKGGKMIKIFTGIGIGLVILLIIFLFCAFKVGGGDD